MRALLIAALIGLAMPAVAQQTPCGPIPIILKSLDEGYGETPEFAMTDRGKNSLLLTLNVQTGTWTILALRGQMLCGVISGENFSNAPPGIRKGKEIPGEDS